MNKAFLPESGVTLPILAACIPATSLDVDLAGFLPRLIKPPGTALATVDAGIYSEQKRRDFVVVPCSKTLFQEGSKFLRRTCFDKGRPM
jgi:hypothetical protein